MTRSSLGGGRVDDVLDLGDRVCGEAALRGVFADHVLVWGDIDAVDLVTSHIALDPLDPRPKLLKHAAGCLRDGLQLLGRRVSNAGDLAFNNVFWHSFPPESYGFGAAIAEM